MAGRLSISFLLSDEAGSSTSPVTPPDVNLAHNVANDDDSPPTVYSSYPSLLRGQPVLLASSQLPPAPRPQLFTYRQPGSQCYGMSDLELPSLSHSGRSFTSPHRSEYDEPHFHASNPDNFSPPPSPQRPSSRSPNFAYMRPGSPVASYNSSYSPHSRPISSQHMLSALQLPPPFHPTHPSYMYSRPQSGPSPIAGNYLSMDAQSPFDRRSSSHSNPDIIMSPRDQDHSTSNYPPSFRHRSSPSPSTGLSPGHGTGLDALVQAATQERSRLSIDFGGPQGIRHQRVYSPNLSDYAPSGSAPEVPYSPDLRTDISIEPPHKRSRSSTSQHEAARARVFEVMGEERFTQDRSSYMRIGHISDYNLSEQLSSSGGGHPSNLMLGGREYTGSRPASRASSAYPPTESESADSQALEQADTEVSIVGEEVHPPPQADPDEEFEKHSSEHDSDSQYEGGERNNSYPSLHAQSATGAAECTHMPEIAAQGSEVDVSNNPAVRSPSVLSINSEQHRLRVHSPFASEQEPEDTLKADVENDDTTVDMEFDLAAGKSESGFSMEIDVEDELLRLVDDEPARDHHHRGAHESRRRSLSTPNTDILLDIEASLLPATEIVPSSPKTAEVQQPPSENTTLKKSTKGAASRRKQPIGKAQTKAKPPGKSRAKAATKTKNKIQQSTDSLSVSYTASGRMTKPAALFPASVANTKLTGSGSTSVMPSAEVREMREQVDQDGEKENSDDKVYCICKSQYEEGKVMIACDRCDEWYHMQCLGMSDLEVELVDQFICPVCVENNRPLFPGTTYKQRCFAGLKHHNPSSSDSCHKPARGAFSKYCSEECGISYMQTKVEAWAANGGNKARLWDSVKDADQREGVVIAVQGDRIKTEAMIQETALPSAASAADGKPRLAKQKERELVRLHAQLDEVSHLREGMKSEMEIILWRATLTQLASERAEGLDECGWDQRLCMDNDEYAEAGASVLESYGEAQGSDGQGTTQEVSGEWWCRGRKKCDRHAGWQKLRDAEVAFEKEMKEAGLSQLATREREIRKRMEDITDPRRPALVGGMNVAPAVNGNAGRANKVNGVTMKPGKKRKAGGN